MSQELRGDPPSMPSVLPVKRKRGRPRKDQTLNPMAITQVPPGFEGVKENPRVSDSIDDGVVGQAVTGVVEAAFDAGYLLTVRIGNPETNLRGVVFKPGHYLPVTAENDVAPHVQMIRRNEIHMHGNSQYRTSAGQNASSPVNHSHGLALRTSKTKSKAKYAASTAPSVPPVGARGTVVPVVLQPAGMSNGTNQAPQCTSSDLDDDAVHTVEPLAMLPPDALAPTRRVHVVQSQSLPSQNFASQQVQQGNAQDGNGSLNGVSRAGQGGGNPVKATEMNKPDDLATGHQGPSLSLEMHNMDNDEACKSFSDNPNLFQEQHFPAVQSDIQQSINGSQPLNSYPTGRMTELLLALQENMQGNQVANAQHPSSSSESDDEEDSTD